VARSEPLPGWREPVEAYLLLRAAGLKPLLFDGLGAHPEARHAVLAFSPRVEVRIQGRDVEERWSDGAWEVFQEEPLAYLRRRVGPAQGPSTGPFTGGWAGAVGFAFARSLEPSLPAGASSALPDVVLRDCQEAVTFDRAARTWALHCEEDDRIAEVQAILAGTPEAPRVAPTQPAWTPSMAQAGFEAEVVRLKARVHDGDLFQANLATRWSAPCAADPAALFAALQQANPSPWMALLEFDGFALVSASPEQLFAIEDGRIRARPIAGTRKRGATPAEDEAMAAELRADPKEQAEHTMLVDLVRNDLARVSQPGSVRVGERMSVERYRHVMHLVSRVEGTLRAGVHPVDALAALFPGGTVTGAPKLRATQRILEAEPAARGFYTGSAGFIGRGHQAHWNILIRTLQLEGGLAHVHAGSGIVADSDPAREWKEAGRKAQALLEAATGQAGATGAATRLGEVEAAGAWEPPRAEPRHPDARVLLVDNEDSFVHNLADYCAALGATVEVVRNRVDVAAAAAAHRATHVVLSPGPGWPREAPRTLEAARALHGRLPILGVCLGHQAIGEAHGGTVRVHPRGPVHGKADAVHHAGAGLFAGLPSPIAATRYHSLAVETAGMGPDWQVDAWLADGTVMALRHAAAPTYGLQFHPESLCTPLGLELLDRFLRVRR
jgi:anthranilate synthase/aminodeoxychorismate synthase-like glutamine amidotransferase